MSEHWNVVWSQGKQKLHKFSHSALSPSPRRNWVIGIQTMLGVKTGGRGGERDLLRETRLTAGKRLGGGGDGELWPCLSFSPSLLSQPRLVSSKCRNIKMWDNTDNFSNFEERQRNITQWWGGSTQRAQLSCTGPYRWCFMAKKNKKNNPTKNSADGAGKPCLSTRCSCHTRHWGVRRCVSSLITDHKALDSLS